MEVEVEVEGKEKLVVMGIQIENKIRKDKKRPLPEIGQT